MIGKKCGGLTFFACKTDNSVNTAGYTEGDYVK